jgi:hypothetical protein
MIKTLPLRLTILHLAQRFRIDGETFIQQFSLLTTISLQIAKGLIIHAHLFFVQNTQIFAWVMGQSGFEVLLR